MKMGPFIQAQEAEGHGVKRGCDVFEVSKSAYYQGEKHRSLDPCARERAGPTRDRERRFSLQATTPRRLSMPTESTTSW